MNIQTINSMLECWARFYYHYDFGGLGYPTRSAMKPAIKSTLPRSDIKIPDNVALIDAAMIRLTQRQRQVVNAEYLRRGHYKNKAECLCMQYSTYRSTLSHAKNNIMQILDNV